MKYLKKFNEAKGDKLYRRIRYNDGNIEFGELFTGKKRNTLDKLLVKIDTRVLTEIEKYKTDYIIRYKESGWYDSKDQIKYIQAYTRSPFEIYIRNIVITL